MYFKITKRFAISHFQKETSIEKYPKTLLGIQLNYKMFNNNELLKPCFYISNYTKRKGGHTICNPRQKDYP